MIAGLFEYARRVGILAYLSMFGVLVRFEGGDNPFLHPPHVVATEQLRILQGEPHQFWLEALK